MSNSAFYVYKIKKLRINNISTTFCQYASPRLARRHVHWAQVILRKRETHDVIGMSTCFVSNICFLFLFLYVVASDTRRFWQVTDFHHDPNYTTVGDPGNVGNRRMCHRTADYRSNSSAGRFGNYLCDAPWSLVEAAVEGMKEIEPNPDFILWTG